MKIVDIQRVVAEQYGIDIEDMKSKDRARRVARPRQVAMALACQFSDKSLPIIGRAFKRDHTTVMHARDKIAELRTTSYGFALRFNEVLLAVETELS